MGKEAAENKTPALIKVDQRVEKALKLQAEGRSWRETGKELDCDSGNLYRACVVRGYNGDAGQPQVEGGVQIGTNVCDGDTICP